ncbi:MAG TPA: DUF5666 domain-containing protein [Anaerolineales bacterium]|nr:DUF5666 domain-containing protein [Anaerolineales bacterium]
MKIYRVLLLLCMAFIWLFIATQVFASPANIPPAQNTPGANATQRAEEKATQQASKENQPKGKHEHYQGIVTAADATSLTLTLRDGSSVTIGLTPDTRIKFAGPKWAAPTSIVAGMTANVQALRDENNNLVARMVLIKPDKPSKIHRVGIVTEYAPGASITIQAKDGNTYTFTITGEIKLLPPERADQLAVGSRVTIIAPRDPATGGWIVKGIVVHPATP